MKKRLSFGWTATIMVASLFLYYGIFSWLQTTLNFPGWASTIGKMLIFLLIFEIPTRIGPEPFDTIFSTVSKFSLKDKLIFLIPLSLAISLLILTEIGNSKTQLSLQANLMFVLLELFLALGPLWFFGSPEAKRLFFKTKSQNK